MMPGKTGLEFTYENKKKIDTPILLLTAKGEASERIEGLEVGADDYLPKPFEPKELTLRINNILKKTNDGFLIADEDMKLRGYGDIVGFQQSGIKYFKIADPIHHEDLFKIAEKNIKDIKIDDKNFKRFEFLIKLFDRAEIVNEFNINYEGSDVPADTINLDASSNEISK